QPLTHDDNVDVERIANDPSVIEGLYRAGPITLDAARGFVVDLAIRHVPDAREQTGDLLQGRTLRAPAGGRGGPGRPEPGGDRPRRARAAAPRARRAPERQCAEKRGQSSTPSSLRIRATTGSRKAATTRGSEPPSVVAPPLTRCEGRYSCTQRRA